MALSKDQFSQPQLFDTEGFRSFRAKPGEYMSSAERQVVQDSAQGPILHTHPHQARDIADSGEYRTQHHTGTSNGGYMPEARRAAEEDYGWNHPVYGGIGRSNNYDQYGNVRISLDHKHWKNTTVTGDDSLNTWDESNRYGEALPTPTPLSELLSHPNPAIDPDPSDSYYVEAQVDTADGKIPVSDFSRVEMPGISGEQMRNHIPRQMSWGQARPQVIRQRRDMDAAADSFEAQGVPVERTSQSHQPVLPGFPGQRHRGGTLVESHMDYKRRRHQERVTDLEASGRLKRT